MILIPNIIIIICIILTYVTSKVSLNQTLKTKIPVLISKLKEKRLYSKSKSISKYKIPLFKNIENV